MVDHNRYFRSKAIVSDNLAINDYSIHFEIHGNGPKKALFVMGLFGTIQNFFPFVNYFGAKEEYSVLVVDNRGAGQSTSGSLSRYTTSGMARDLLAVLDNIGWTAAKSFHLVGISMGGMISQELALLIPERIRSLTLLATYAYFTLPKYNLTLPLKMFKPKADDESDIESLMKRLFSDPEWLDAHDGRYEMYTNNRQRLKEYLLARKQESPIGRKASIGQLAAVTTHKLSPLQLESIGKSISNVVCIVGSGDKMIDPANTEYLAEHIGCSKIILPNKGHSLVHEAETEVIAELVKMFEN